MHHCRSPEPYPNMLRQHQTGTIRKWLLRLPEVHHANIHGSPGCCLLHDVLGLWWQCFLVPIILLGGREVQSHSFTLAPSHLRSLISSLSMQLKIWLFHRLLGRSRGGQVTKRPPHAQCTGVSIAQPLTELLQFVSAICRVELTSQGIIQGQIPTKLSKQDMDPGILGRVMLKAVQKSNQAGPRDEGVDQMEEGQQTALEGNRELTDQWGSAGSRSNLKIRKTIHNEYENDL